MRGTAPTPKRRLALLPRHGFKGGPRIGPTPAQMAVIHANQPPAGYKPPAFLPRPADPVWNYDTGMVEVGKQTYDAFGGKPGAERPSARGGAVHGTVHHEGRKRALKRLTVTVTGRGADGIAR